MSQQHAHHTPPTLANSLSSGAVFSTIHAISGRLSPVPGTSRGIEVLETDTFTLQCLETATGYKFFTVADCSHPELDVLLQRIYTLFSDYVLKNPFYENDQGTCCGGSANASLLSPRRHQSIVCLFRW